MKSTITSIFCFQSKQQEMLSKVLMSSNSSANFSVPPPSNVRPPSVVSNAGSLPYITPEIQIMINSVQPTRELMQRADTLNIIRGMGCNVRIFLV